MQRMFEQKRSEGEGSVGCEEGSEALFFYNFMELPYDDFVADRDVIAKRSKRSWEGSSDAVDVDLKL